MDIILHLTKTAAAQNEVAFSYHSVYCARAIFSGSCFCEKYSFLDTAD